MSPIEPISGDDLRTALAIILAEPGSGQRAARASVRAFMDHVSETRLQCTGAAIRRGRDLVAAVVTLLMPGGTALIMPAAPGELGVEGQAQDTLLAHNMRELRGARLHYVQSLVEPAAISKRALLRAAGFDRLAVLLYLERDSHFPWLDAPAADAVQWVAYAADTHVLFATTVEATYTDSHDCPAISSLRPIDDILAGHRAAGPFDPERWEVALVAGEPAGCILLSCIGTDMLEVVYMGVVPTQRGRGIGALLLQRAIAHARVLRRKRVTLVVDECNAPARALYARLGFACVATREVYIVRCAEGVEKL